MGFDYYVNMYFPDVNYIGRFRMDFLAASLNKLTAGLQTFAGYFFYELFIFCVGSLWLLRCLGQDKPKNGNNIAAIISLAACIIFVCGLDPNALSVCWFPALVSSFICLRVSLNFTSVVVAIFISTLWVYNTSPLTFFGTVIALIAAVLVQPIEDSKNAKITSYIFSVVSCVLIFVSIFLMPESPVPNYPDGRLTPITPFTFRGAPSVGPWVEPVMLLWKPYREAVLGYAFRVLAVFSLILFLVWKSNPKNILRTSVFLILLGILGLEYIMLPNWSAYTPFQTLWRAFPGIALVEVVWVLIPLFLLWGWCVVRENLTNKGFAIVLVASLLGVFCDKILDTHMWHRPVEPQEFLVHNATIAKGVGKGTDGFASKSVVSIFGDWILARGIGKERSFDALDRLSPNVDYNVKTDASLNKKEVIFATDNDPDTRWRTARPQQPGDWFSMVFDRDIEVVKIVLSVKNVSTDFPRGITVYGMTGDGQWNKIFIQPHWHGPVIWTDEGFPYFGNQSSVVLDLPVPQKVHGLKFEQILSDPRFDWSIEEIKLYRLPLDN